MKRNQTKLKFKEMNVKQRIFFVLDWIMRGVLLLTLALFVVAIGMNCADRNNSSDTVAYADWFSDSLNSAINSSDETFSTTDTLSENSAADEAYNTSGFDQYNLNLFFPASNYYGNAVTATSENGIVTIIHNNSNKYAGINLISQYNTPNNQLYAGNTYTVVLYNSVPINISLEVWWYVSDTQYKSSSIQTGVPIVVSLPQNASNIILHYQNNVEYNGSFNLLIAVFTGTYTAQSFPPYQPNLQNIYESAYNTGNSAGLEQGKQEGIQSVTDSFSGIFFNSTLNVAATYYDNVSDDTYNKSFSDLTPNLGFNTVLFNSTYNYLASAATDPSNDDLQSATVTINLDQPFAYNPDRPFYISGSSRSDIFDITLVDINGTRYSGTFNSDRNYFAEFPASTNIDNAAAISSIILYFGRASDTMSDASLTQDSGGYYQGYNNGLSDGKSEGYTEGKDAGINIGYSQGYQAGFDEAGGGGFSWLISSVQGFLDTKFFGDFGVGTLLYVGLGITLATLFIKFFAGG